MPKNTLVIAAVVVVIIAAIGGYLFLNKNSSPVVEESMTQENNGVMGEINDILTSGKSLECNYVDPQRGTVVAYVKDGKVRVNYTASEENNSGSVIIKDKMMYFWNKSGAFKMAVPDDKDIDEAAGTATQQNPDEVVKNIEEYKDSCKEASVADSQFDLPTGVEFQDFSAMMEGAMEQKGTSGSQAPTIDPKYQQMIDQYSNPQ